MIPPLRGSSSSNDNGECLADFLQCVVRADPAYQTGGVLLGMLAGGVVGHFRTSQFGRRIFLLPGALFGLLAGGLAYALVSDFCR